MFVFSSLIQRLDTWIADEYRLPAGALGAFRILYAGYILFVVGAPEFRWIAQHPALFFDPPPYSFANLFHQFPGHYFFLIIDLLVVVLLVFLLFGFRTRLTSMSLATVMLIGFSFYHSFGKINHDTLLMVITSLLMAFSGWGSRYAIDQSSPRHHASGENYWPVATLAVILSFAMFSAGFPKLVEDGSLRNGWLSLSTQAVKGYAIVYQHDDLAGNYLAPIFLEYAGDFLWETLDWVAVVFEIGFLFAVVRRPWFRFFVLVAVLFHFMNGLLLSISFVNNITLYLLFIYWLPVLAWFERLPTRLIRRPVMIAAVVGLTAAYGFHLPVNLTALLLAFGADDLSASLLLMGLACGFFSYNYFCSLRKLPAQRLHRSV